MVDNKDHSLRQIDAEESEGDTSPAWSPTGEEIAFASIRDGTQVIRVADVDGHSIRTLSQQPGNWPTWSPDGGSIVFVTNVGGVSEVYLSSSDGLSQHQITALGLVLETPAWNSDGSRIFFSLMRDAGDWNIFSVKPDGSGLEGSIEYPDSIERSPGWSLAPTD